MTLGDLLPVLPEARVEGPVDRPLSALRYDSRRVEAGDIFFAWKGAGFDGHQFVPDACRRGAAAVVLERELERPENAAFVRVPDARRALALLAGRYYGNPAAKLEMVGVTGTNGKTTTAFVVQHLLGGKIGLLGTVHYQTGAETLPASRTTPEGSDLQEMLAKMVAAGCRAAVMEVSSHALDQGRVAGIGFAAAVFTNLTPDHLDYHPTMEAYFEAKRLLFSQSRAAVVNLDDPYGRRLAGELAGEVIAFSPSGAAAAPLRAENVRTTPRGTEFELVWKELRLPVRMPLLGDFNVANVLGALGACLALGRPVEELAARLESLPAVPGRLERFGKEGQPSVVVDYAHTEDAVRKALATLRQLRPKRLAVVLGCGGSRDRTKRPRMAAAAVELADRVYFTSDNPRGESQEQIFADMRAGVPAEAPAAWIADRREAIARAIAEAGPDDLVCIAGKGHESTQEIAGVHHPFSDRDVVGEILA
ncbi:MAG: UDP-N-acetylmuramoyl-L-alanyl-D-glutamate--2,6-diaminopimelate ligase [Verrucomicrobium sp.]|nr:UDP-N-acetylmuramoyl-L-alanyl-D-glutamate--2,6-diaminopimelate ligase [Verrucomicrobium sp.]